ncbi:MAG TPA: hypothetical protein VIP77_18755 [Jiangellaceae bacterium]
MTAIDDLQGATTAASSELESSLTYIKLAADLVDQERKNIGQGIGLQEIAKNLGLTAERVNQAAGMVSSTQSTVDGVTRAIQGLTVANEKSAVLAALAANGHSFNNAIGAVQGAIENLTEARAQAQTWLGGEYYASSVVAAISAAITAAEPAVTGLSQASGQNTDVESATRGVG